MAKRMRRTPERVGRKLTEADRLLAEGKDVAEVCRVLQVTEATYYRWRNQFGGLKADDARKLEDLERENATLERLLAEAELEKAASKEIATGGVAAGFARRSSPISPHRHTLSGRALRGSRIGRGKVATASIGALVLVACGSPEVTSPAVHTSTPITTAEQREPCPDMQKSPTTTRQELMLAKDIQNLPLPVGTCLFMVNIGDDIDREGLLYVTIDLDVAGSTSPNDLRPIATPIAGAVKKAAIGPQVAILDVTNHGTPRPAYRALVTDENFQGHPWDGSGSLDSDLKRWRVVEQE